MLITESHADVQVKVGGGEPSPMSPSSLLLESGTD